MSNALPHERFFKLLAKVLMLVLDKKRYIFYVHGVLTGKRATQRGDAGTNWYQLINDRIGEILSKPEEHLERAVSLLQEILDGPSPIFVEFTVRVPTPSENLDSMGSEGQLVYLVGTSLEDVLADTNSGTNFGLLHFSNYRTVSEDEVRSKGRTMLDHGIDSVKRGYWSYSLG